MADDDHEVSSHSLDRSADGCVWCCPGLPLCKPSNHSSWDCASAAMHTVTTVPCKKIPNADGRVLGRETTAAANFNDSID